VKEKEKKEEEEEEEWRLCRYIDFLTLKKEAAKRRLLFRITCNFFGEEVATKRRNE